MQSGWSEKAKALEWRGGQGGGSSVGYAGTTAAWGGRRWCQLNERRVLHTH